MRAIESILNGSRGRNGQKKHSSQWAAAWGFPIREFFEWVGFKMPTMAAVAK
jgi:hypothetical protein